MEIEQFLLFKPLKPFKGSMLEKLHQAFKNLLAAVQYDFFVTFKHFILYFPSTLDAYPSLEKIERGANRFEVQFIAVQAIFTL